MSNLISHEAAESYCASSRRSSGRAHLPIAPKAQARVRYSPGSPLPRALSPEQALNWLEYLGEQGEIIKVVNINGPGDPLATPELTLQTIAMLRERYPGISICLTTLGFGAGELAGRLAELGLAHVSILLEAVDPEVAENIYAWIRPGTKTLPISEAACILVEEQAAAIAALVKSRMVVKIKTTVYPGINSKHVLDIAKQAAKLGASEMKLFPFLAVGDECPRPTEEAVPAELEYLAGQANKYLPTQLIDLETCRQLAGMEFADQAGAQTRFPKPSPRRPNLAVCSSDGFEVNLHLGQAYQYLIYGPQDGPVSLLEIRPAPEPGGGDTRWHQAALTLNDCFAVLAIAAGEAPKCILAEKGLEVITQEGNVEGLVDALYGGGKKRGGKKN
jgi:nitrogen fixation protein NifB